MIDTNVANFFIKNHSTCRAHTNLSSNERVFVLVETRCAFWLPFVIRNFINVLGASWNVHLFLARDVAVSLKEEFGHCTFDVTVIQDKLTVPEYSALLEQSPFWSTIREEHVLIGQLDTVLLRPIPEDFFKYAYVGAPCGDISGDQFILNGGLSLRRRSVMLDITSQLPGNGQDPEDIYFTRILRAMKAPLPGLTEAIQFCAESIIAPDNSPCGVHGTHKYWIPTAQMRVLVDTAASAPTL